MNTRTQISSSLGKELSRVPRQKQAKPVAKPRTKNSQRGLQEEFFLNKTNLPLHIKPDRGRDYLEKRGFVFKNQISSDGLAQEVAFPPGWKKRRTSQACRFQLVDKFDRPRGMMLYIPLGRNRKASLELFI